MLFLLAEVGFLRLLVVSTGLDSDRPFFVFFVDNDGSADSVGDADFRFTFVITGVLERARVEGTSGDGTIRNMNNVQNDISFFQIPGASGLVSLVFVVVLARFMACSGGLIVSGGDVVDVLGFARFRPARFAVGGGDGLTTIISGSTSDSSLTGDDGFSLRPDRFDNFFFVCVVDGTSGSLNFVVCSSFCDSFKC